jgi:uncharacterized membrane protein YagU involved in acid resistance
MVLERSLRLSLGTDPVALLAAVIGYTAEAGRALPFAWLIHFVVGTLVWGVAYVWLEPRLTGSPAARGMTFGVLAWLVMMLLVMPLTGAGLFGFGYGLGVPLTLLAVHLAYGAVLGLVYSRLRRRVA